MHRTTVKLSRGYPYPCCECGWVGAEMSSIEWAQLLADQHRMHEEDAVEAVIREAEIIISEHQWRSHP